MQYCVTGAASGIGRATATRLRNAGHTVFGVDLAATDVAADLSTAAGRRAAVEQVASLAGGNLDGVVTCAGLGPVPSRAGSAIVSVNYFGTVAILEGLRPLLQDGGAAVAISSNSVTTAPGVPADLIELCLAGDEEAACARADELGTMANVYPASKVAVAWWVRAHAVTPTWIGAGIRLNAIAPGMIDTAMIAEGNADTTMGPLLAMFPMPIGRMGSPEEVAAVATFLLSDDAGFFCGSVLFVDGGTDALLRTRDWPAPWDVRRFPTG